MGELEIGMQTWIYIVLSTHRALQSVAHAVLVPGFLCVCTDSPSGKCTLSIVSALDAGTCVMKAGCIGLASVCTLRSLHKGTACDL